MLLKDDLEMYSKLFENFLQMEKGKFLEKFKIFFGYLI
jgi:hypothetical protein